MSSPDPADALQVALYERLTGDATLDDLVAGVFDQVPERAEYPYIVIGEVLATARNVHGDLGRMNVATVHTWTRARSHRPGNTIAARVVALLDHRVAELDALVVGHTVEAIRHEFMQTLTDPTPGIRHRVDRFRIPTRQSEE